MKERGENMKLKKITDRVYYLPHDPDTDRPVLGYIRGDKYTLAIEAGNSQDHVYKFYEALSDNGLKEPSYTAITHWHWDHTFGMHAISGKSIVCLDTNEKLKEVSKWGWSPGEMSARLESGAEIEFCDQYIKVEYEDPEDIKVITSDLVFEGELTIDLGGVHCLLSQIVAPHSKDSVLAYIPEERVLFVGDAEYEDFYDCGGIYDKESVLSYIETIKEIEFDYYIRSHHDFESKEDALIRLEELLSTIN